MSIDFNGKNNFKCASFNCFGLKSSYASIDKLSDLCEITYICEHWLKQSELNHVQQHFRDQDRVMFP